MCGRMEPRSRGRRHGVVIGTRQRAQTVAFVAQEEVTVSVRLADRCLAAPLTRRSAVAMGLTLAGGALTAASGRPAVAAPLRQATPVATPAGDQAEAILAIVREIMEKQDVKAVIV